MNLTEYISKEFKSTPTKEQLNQIYKLCLKAQKELNDKEKQVYKDCAEFWLKEFHIGWDFGAMQGKSLKSIIVKIKKRLKDFDKTVTDKLILDTFKYICNNLPEWFKDKDLNVINSKFNEITEQIKRPSNNSKRVNIDNLQQIAEQRYGNTKESV
jgi:hypothetical protein